jgi:hypothetical protein
VTQGFKGMPHRNIAIGAVVSIELLDRIEFKSQHANHRIHRQALLGCPLRSHGMEHLSNAYCSTCGIALVD